MDYEEKYKIAFKRFKAWREKYLTKETAFGDVIYDKTGEMQAEFNAIFPELAESEDEKIRDWLITQLRNNYKGNYWATQAIAWLEKQKEPEDIIGKAISYFGAESLLDNANGLTDFEKFTAWLYCEFLRGLPKKLNQEYIKEQTKVILDAAQKELCRMPDSTELIDMWEQEKKVLEEKDFRGDAWRIAYNAFMDGFARGTCVKFEKQKEQKPVKKEKVEITDFEQSVYDLCPVLGIEEAKATASDLLELAKKTLLKTGKVVLASNYPEGCSFEDGFHLGYTEGFNAKQEQKPAEWSEKHIANIFEKVGLAKIVREQGNDKLTNALQDAMLELSKVGNTEWSEEDEKIRQSIIKDIEWERNYTSATTGEVIGKYNEQIAWLKSLRPQSKEELAKMLQDEYNKGKEYGEREGHTKGYNKGYKDAEEAYNKAVSYHLDIPNNWPPQMPDLPTQTTTTGEQLNKL